MNKTKNRQEHFTKIPNEYIQGNINEQFGLSRKFYIVYILIDRYRTIEDYSWITINKVLEFYGYKKLQKKPKVFREIIEVLEYMRDNKLIKVKQDLNSLGYDTGIEIEIIPENFDCRNNFTKITLSQLETIKNAKVSVNKESLLTVFLYISSYMMSQSKQNYSSNKEPEAFFKSINSMSEELSMSKNTIMQCVDYLTTSSETHTALFVRRKVGYVPTDKDRKPMSIPSIYVLNKTGYQKELDKALAKIKDLYQISDAYLF